MLRNTLILILLVFSVLSPCKIYADTHTCVADCGTTCSQTAVQTVINSASFVTGDVLYIPAGLCTWTSQVSIPSTKKVTIQGAGKNSTVITTSTVTAIHMNESGSRITGMGFIMTGEAPGQIQVQGTGWRIDNCKFHNATGTSRVTIWAHGTNVSSTPIGLIDHNEFIEARINIIRSSNIEEARALWSKGNPFGTANNVYIEDNSFYKTVSGGGNVIDAEAYCGSYVARFNVVTGNTEFMVHPFTNSSTRGPTLWEIYGNSFRASNPSTFTPMFIRAGTGFVFNNSISGYSFNGVVFDNWRSFSAVTGTGPTGMCDGSSTWDGNIAANGWPCRDQIGRGKDLWLWTDANPYPPQESSPSYLWLNRVGASIAPVTITNGSDAWIQSNRDYYSEVSQFDGTTGVGYGTLANRPTTCTKGVGYWATDQGTWNKTSGGQQGVLYKCTAVNTWTLYYTPYTYPHPLITSGSLSVTEPSSPPSPPLKLRIMQ